MTYLCSMFRLLAAPTVLFMISVRYYLFSFDYGTFLIVVRGQTLNTLFNYFFRNYAAKK